MVSSGDIAESVVQEKAAAQLLATMAREPSETKVRLLIERLVSTDRSEVQRAVTALVLLGPEAVPEMTRRIDDRREMAVHTIAFRDRSPQAFEAAVR
jgi:hypothetical protein